MANLVNPTPKVMKSLKRDENIYQDNNGCWIAEYIIIDDNGNERWERLGTYGSSVRALGALISARSEF